MKMVNLVETIVPAAHSTYSIYRAVADHMDQLEIESGLTGAQKKAVVLDFVKHELVDNWVYWFGLISKFIDSIKTIYNIVK